MGDFDGALAAIFLVAVIVSLVITIWACWMIAGFICATLGWSAMSGWAQFCVTIVMAFMLGGRIKS